MTNLKLPILALGAMSLAGCVSPHGVGCSDCAKAAADVKLVAKVARTASGQPIRFPQGRAEVSAFTYVIPPGAKLPVHKHPYPRFAYVLEGDLRVALLNGQSNDYHAGQFVAEVVDTWHFGATLGKRPVKLFVLDATPQGVSNVVKK